MTKQTDLLLVPARRRTPCLALRVWSRTQHEQQTGINDGSKTGRNATRMVFAVGFHSSPAASSQANGTGAARVQAKNAGTWPLSAPFLSAPGSNGVLARVTSDPLSRR
jgi:hypothetical protein